MNRKAKIITNLSVITIVLAGVAQFYTNRKIDQTLAQFPYHFANEFTLHAEVKDKDFFTRDVLFSIEDSQGVKRHIINSHLIAFPFAVTARSELTPDVIKNLNKSLNITIDRNVINSKFSVVGDYLQSSMETKFRDVTNQGQSLTTDLNFIAKTNFIEIDTALSGFNYNAVTKFNQVEGHYQLQPLGNHRYDLVKADMRAELIDITDGDNKHYKIDNADYQLNKSFSDSEYNLDTAFSGDKFVLTYSDERWAMNNFTLTSKQQGVAQDMLLLEQLKKLDSTEPNIKQILTALSGYLLNNKQWQLAWNFDQGRWEQAEKALQWGKTVLDFNFTQQNEQLADFSWNLKIALLSGFENKQQFGQIKNLAFNSQSVGVNLAESLRLAEKYLPEQISENQTSKKDNDKFINDFQALVKNYKPTTKSALSIGHIDAAMNNFVFHNLKMDWQDSIAENNEFEGKLIFNAEQIASKESGLSLNKVALEVPLKLFPYTQAQALYFCTQQYYALLCRANLSEQTLQKWWQEALAKTQAQLAQGDLRLQLDTYPKSSGAEKIEVQLDANLPQADGKVSDGWGKLQKLNLDLTATLPERLFNEKNEINQRLANSFLWQTLTQWKQTGNLLQRDEQQYQLRLAIQEGRAFLNGKDLDNLMNNETDTEGEEIPPEEQEQDNQTNETTK